MTDEQEMAERKDIGMRPACTAFRSHSNKSIVST
jgi:hypothetical protein